MAHSRFTLVLQCDSLKEFQAAATRATPALCLFAAQDRAVPRSAAQVAELRRSAPNLRIVALSERDADREAFLSAGADRHVSNGISPEGLIMVLGALMDQSPHAGDKGDGGEHRGCSGGAPDRLSAREIEVIEAIARGQSNKGVARQLSIAEPTVKAHVRAILRKTGVANRTQVALWLARRQHDVGLHESPMASGVALEPERRTASSWPPPKPDRTGTGSAAPVNARTRFPTDGSAALPAGGR